MDTSRTASDEFTSALENHLTDCHINWKKYKKLNKILSGIKKLASGTDDLLEKFTNKCYASQKDTALARKQARTFLDALFGDVESLYKLGPNKALENKVRTLQAASGPKVSDSNIIEMKLVAGAGPTFAYKPTGGKADTSEGSIGKLWRRQIGDYLVGPVLGSGGTAKVRLGLKRSTKEEVAIKILKPRFKDDAKREIETLEALQHDNIIKVKDKFFNVRVHGSYNQPTSVFVLEYADKGELIEYLMYTERFEPSLARWFFKCLLDAVEHCHKHGYCHRDLKHDNCLLGEDFVVKVTDFGFTKKPNEKGYMQTAIGTEQYAAPEILAHTEYTNAVDIFAMGVMLFIALAGCQPFKRADSKDRWYSMICKEDWKGFWKYHKRAHKFEKSAMNLLQQMLCAVPAKRITIDKIKETRWYAGETMTQEQAADALRLRKERVDLEKFQMGERSGPDASRALPCDQPVPVQWWSAKPPDTAFWFYSTLHGPTIQKKLLNCVRGLNAEVTTPADEAEDDMNLDLTNIMDDEEEFSEDEDELADGRSNPYIGRFQVKADNKDVTGEWRIFSEGLNEEEQKKIDVKIRDVGIILEKEKMVLEDALKNLTSEAFKARKEEAENSLTEAEKSLEEANSALEADNGDHRAELESDIKDHTDDIESNKKLLAGLAEVLEQDPVKPDSDVAKELLPEATLKDIRKGAANLTDEYKKKAMDEKQLKNLKPYYTEDERRDLLKKNIVVFRPTGGGPVKNLKGLQVKRKDVNRFMFPSVYKEIIKRVGAEIMHLDWKEPEEDDDDEDEEDDNQ